MRQACVAQQAALVPAPSFGGRSSINLPTPCTPAQWQSSHASGCRCSLVVNALAAGAAASLHSVPSPQTEQAAATAAVLLVGFEIEEAEALCDTLASGSVPILLASELVLTLEVDAALPRLGELGSGAAAGFDAGPSSPGPAPCAAADCVDSLWDLSTARDTPPTDLAAAPCGLPRGAPAEPSKHFLEASGLGSDPCTSQQAAAKSADQSGFSSRPHSAQAVDAALLLPASRGGDGRLALLLGAGRDGRAALAETAAWLDEYGLSAVLAAAQPHHARMRLADVICAVRCEHERVHAVRQPLALASGAAAAVPPEASVALNLALDAGFVIDPRTGELTPDDSRVVVLDGLLREHERAGLLAWLTAPGWDHAAGPPEAKWARACVDREGDAATWGLRPEVQQALQEDPLPEVLALQARLAELYPEFSICHMPCSAVEPPNDCWEADDDAAAVPLSAFVGNAVEAGQACSWHTDFDPFHAPVGSPWEARYGRYGNRQRGKPLCVSLVLYLNEAWPPEFDAETLFLDPGTGTGVLVRPAPGRLVLMDADITHRISPPSPLAQQPRYSLVWKLVFFPRDEPACGDLPASGLARSEWGAPTRLGTSAGLPAPALGV